MVVFKPPLGSSFRVLTCVYSGAALPTASVIRVSRLFRMMQRLHSAAPVLWFVLHMQRTPAQTLKWLPSKGLKWFFPALLLHRNNVLWRYRAHSCRLPRERTVCSSHIVKVAMRQLLHNGVLLAWPMCISDVTHGYTHISCCRHLASPVVAQTNRQAS